MQEAVQSARERHSDNDEHAQVAVRLTPHSVATRRLAAQWLVRPVPRTPADLVRWCGAVQSQDLPLAKWSVGQRLDGCTERDVTAALTDGAILRTHVLRPTWHFVARDDLRWMLALTAPRVLAKLRPYDARAGLDAATAAKGVRAIEKALDRRGPLTRTQLAQVLRASGSGDVSNWLVGHVLMHAELRGVVCSGPARGAQQTYALLDQRAPAPATLTREEAIVELARRYFQSHAPATELDYRWWSGLGAADARRGIDALGDALERAALGDSTCLLWRAADTVRPSSTTAHLLQPFDEMVVAYSESRHAVDAAELVRQRKPDGLLTRSVLVGGQVAGRWSRTLDRRHQLRLELLRPLTTRERGAVAAAVDRFAAFLGEPLAVETSARG